MTENKLADIPELVSHVLDLKPEKQFWFRGQGCSHRHLMPSLWRRLKPAAGQAEVSSTQVLELETRLLTRFRQRSLPYWPAGYPQTDWEHLFAMQHYGLPTRLLDWSTNLLMAVYFALDHDATRCECGTGACEPAIWILDPVKLNRTNPRLDGLPVGIMATTDKLLEQWEPGVLDNQFAPAPVAIYGTYNSDRIAAQSGAFTVSGKTMVPLDETAPPAEVLRKIVLTGEPEQIRQQLSLMGITRSSVYPGLAELAQDIANEEIE
ncbi:FRG domain-containing protein [Curtobacterium sp. 22159]|uniref:FRG domain-containing protein n=1 Tax=Curtobacterium sp. 22159 TaxID=3453882 RepID=UPI003F842ECB